MTPAALQEAVRELLAQRGPMETDDLRERLCCASLKRFEAALVALARDGVILRGHGAVRLTGDRRPWPGPGSLNGKWQRLSRMKKAAA